MHACCQEKWSADHEFPIVVAPRRRPALMRDLRYTY
jgi:hypothetical protein